MRSWPLLVILLRCGNFVSCAKKHDEDSSEEDGDDGWTDVACEAYENCLYTYDRLVNDCALKDTKQYDEEDLCYLPIASEYVRLVEKKEKRSKILRQCYVTGIVDSKGDCKTSTGKASRDSDAFVNSKRKRSTCKTKIGEIALFVDNLNNRTNKKGKSTESCRSVARKFKEKCQRLESCCARVKECRQLVNEHPVSITMRQLENQIKEERRECRETQS